MCKSYKLYVYKKGKVPKCVLRTKIQYSFRHGGLMCCQSFDHEIIDNANAFMFCMEKLRKLKQTMKWTCTYVRSASHMKLSKDHFPILRL